MPQHIIRANMFYRNFITVVLCAYPGYGMPLKGLRNRIFVNEIHTTELCLQVGSFLQTSGVDKFCQGAGSPGLGLDIRVVVRPVHLVVPYGIAGALWLSHFVFITGWNLRLWNIVLEYMYIAHVDFNNTLLTQCPV